MRQSIELGSVPTVVHVPQGPGDKLICGMADGRVVMLKITHYANDVKEETLVNDLENTNAVTAIDTYDLTGDGKIELILGRRDGSVQVYSLPSEDNVFDVETRLIYSEVGRKINPLPIAFKFTFMPPRILARVYLAYKVAVLVPKVIRKSLFVPIRGGCLV